MKSDIDLLSKIQILFDVDLESGHFIRKTSSGSRLPGSIAGGVRPDGYIQIAVAGKLYLAHRLLVFVRDGSFPEQVDHINGIKNDNRSENLRSVSCALNSRNQKLSSANKFGQSGIRFRSTRNAFEAYWTEQNGKTRFKYFSCSSHGGYENTKNIATKYRLDMISQMNAFGAGYTNRHGKKLA